MNFTLYRLLPIIFLFCISCADDGSDVLPTPSSIQNSVLTADAGNDQQITGFEIVNLDGSNSADSQNNPFDYEWTFTQRPTGSTANLSGNLTTMPSFTPDVVGVYILSLTISNATTSSTDAVTITVEATTASVEDLGGSIQTDRVLTDINPTPGQPDYCVTKDIDLDAILTIEPGVEIHFAPNVSFQVGDGVLIANGTADKPIVFTAKEKGTYWKGLGFVLADDVRNTLNYVHLSYGGADNISIIDRPATLGFSSFSEVSITNCVIKNSANIGLFAEDDVDFLAFSNNVFEANANRPLVLPADQVHKLDENSLYSLSNGDNSIEIHDGLLRELGAITWVKPKDNTPFVVTDDLNLESQLTIQPGITLLFDADLKFSVGDRDKSYLIANGTANFPITLSALDKNKPWRGLGFILSRSPFNSLDYVHIDYAGLDEISFVKTKTALLISSFSKISIKNTKIANSVGHGIHIEDDVDLTAFENNTLENNANIPLVVASQSLHSLAMNNQFGTSNGTSYIQVIDSGNLEFAETVSWNGFDDNTPYFIAEDIDITENGVVITNNASFLVQSNVDILIRNSGFISIQGTANNPIEFTAFNTALPWRGIGIFTDDIRNSIDYAAISYGGIDKMFTADQPANIAVGHSSKLKLTNSTITNSTGYGMFIHNRSEVTEDEILTNNTFSNNKLGNVIKE